MAKANRKLDLIRAAQASVRTPRAARLVEIDPGARVCGCGCGSMFTPARKHQRFLNDKHRYAAWAATHPRVKVSE